MTTPRRHPDRRASSPRHPVPTAGLRRHPGPGDGGTVIPLLVVGFLLAVTLLAASTAGAAALVARRRLAADCDAAALAGAAALDRTALTAGTPPDPAGSLPDPAESLPPGGSGTTEPLPPGASGPTVPLGLDPVAVLAAVRGAAESGTEVRPTTDGVTVTVHCRRIAAVPFGAVLGRPHGIERTAVSRAQTRIRPST